MLLNEWCVTERCSVLQRVAVCGIVLTMDAFIDSPVCISLKKSGNVWCATECYRVLQCVAACCIVWMCVKNGHDIRLIRLQILERGLLYTRMFYCVAECRRVLTKVTIFDSSVFISSKKAWILLWGASTTLCTATNYSTLQHIATHCSIVHHTTTSCNILQSTETHFDTWPKA